MEYTKKLFALGLITLGLVSINQVNNTNNVSNQIKTVTNDTIDLVQKVKEQEIIANTQELASEAVVEATLYHGLTREQVIDKASRTLNGTLTGTAATFVDYSIERGVDPLLAIGIVLQETGCYFGTCSYLVDYYNNVGGMMGNGGALAFPTLDEGIRAYIDNIANNFVANGLTTAELMNPRYAEDPLWAQRVNAYIERIIAA